MFKPHIIATVNQKVLSLLSKFSDDEFYERQVARSLDIAYGSANRSLNQLYSTGAIKRRREGKMFFYSIGVTNHSVIEFKKLVNLLLLEPLIESLQKVAIRVVLYGSCAQGTDTSQSDFDLFVVTTNKEKAATIISGFNLPDGFKSLRIQPVIKSPVDLLQASESEKVFIEEVERGIVLWEKAASESRIDDTLKFTFIKHDGKKELSQNTNRPEIEYIISELQQLKAKGSNASVGIITPHTNQQKLAMEMISKMPDRDHFFDVNKLKIMTFDTCQGEERDVIFYSMVATEESDRLWGVFIKDLADVDLEEESKIKAQRLNVGFSRAKECIHLVLSKQLDRYSRAIGDALRHYHSQHQLIP